MEISADFPGGNIRVIRIDGDTVILKNELRDTVGDWFYWSFCVSGAGGRRINFRFDEKKRVGYFGAAVSRDLTSWSWSDTRIAYEDGTEGFSYSFREDEDRVYFAHNMYYSTDMFEKLSSELGLKKTAFASSPKGRTIYGYELGDGSAALLMTARHHACESTGNYVIEGALRELSRGLPPGYRVLCLPFVDLDGAVEGDQGKHRAPHDHNRDYNDSPIYDVCQKIMALRDVAAAFDFHSPDHMGGKRNDYPFVARANSPYNDRQDRFCNLFAEASRELPLSYDPAHDITSDAGWNSSQTPNFKNYFIKNASLHTSITLETPYFGLAGMRFTQENAVHLGRAFGAAMRGFAAEMSGS